VRVLDIRIQNIQVDNNFCAGRRKKKREKTRKHWTLDYLDIDVQVLHQRDFTNHNLSAICYC
jgi:hypothetical protein